MPVSVFLFGATGFLGGSVLSALEQEGYDITCLVRPGKEHLLEKRKVKQIVTVSAAFRGPDTRPNSDDPYRATSRAWT